MSVKYPGRHDWVLLVLLEAPIVVMIVWILWKGIE